MKAGLLGLPGSGRRTLFSLLTQLAVRDASRVAQLGVLKIPDSRLDELTRLHESRKTTPATIEFVLIPGLVRGDSKEKLNLPALRNVDVIVHVVRAFEDEMVPHSEGSVDPVRDIELIDLELTLSDLDLVERRLERLEADAGKGKKPSPKEIELLRKARATLQDGSALRAVLTNDEQRALRGYALLSSKPLLLLVNLSESDAARSDLTSRLGLQSWESRRAVRIGFVSCRIESEIAELPEEEARLFQTDLGLKENAVERVVRDAFELLSLITFYTTSEKESHAWVVNDGTKAQAAAGAIHSDIERGFIRAEVVHFDALVAEGTWSQCRDKGRLRVEGKEYIVQDGDVIIFRFNV